MMRRLSVLTALLALLLPVICYAEGTSKEIPIKEDHEGIHAKRVHRLHFYHSSANHTMPMQYLALVPSDRMRKGWREHLLIGFYSDFETRYMSKEVPDSRGPVWQPSATIELYGFGLNVWSNFVLNDEPNQGEFNEVDITSYYTAHIGNLTIHPYIIYMVFPNGDPASLDYSAQTIVETNLHADYRIWRFTIFTLMRARAKGNPGAVYANVGIGYNQCFPHDLTFLTSVLMNFGNDRYLSALYGPMDMNVDAVAFMLGLQWKAWKGFSINPHVDFVVHANPQIRRAIRQIPDIENQMVWGGLDLAYEF